MDINYTRISGSEIGRIAALSDGIFAVAATLIVLDVHTPEASGIHTEGQLLTALGALGPRLMTWLLSLMTLGIFWLGQQTQLNHLARGNRDLAWLHFLFLAVITVLPFSTRLLAEFIDYRTAFVIYWANILLAGASLYATWTLAERAGLVRDDAPPDLSRVICRRILVAQTLYLIAMLIGLVRIDVGITLIVLIQLNYAMAPRLPLLSKI